MFPVLLASVKKEFLITCRHPFALLNPLLFFIVTIMLFPLAITPEASKLQQIGPGVIWIALLFANMLALDQLFIEDHEDGTLEQLMLHQAPLVIPISGKLLAQWLIITLPLLVTSVIAAQCFYLPYHTTLVLAVSILLGSPTLTLLTAMGAALTLGLKHRSLLLIMLIMPLYLPVLIFAASATNDAYLNLPVISQLCFLGAILTLSITFVPFIVAAAIRISLI
jgi:heme exporter protein B